MTPPSTEAAMREKLKAHGDVIIIDLDGMKTMRDAAVATHNVLTAGKAFSEADRNFYLLQIEMKRRDIELDGRLKAIEARLTAIEAEKL
jgi:hypothetical protein